MTALQSTKPIQAQLRTLRAQAKREYQLGGDQAAAGTIAKIESLKAEWARIAQSQYAAPVDPAPASRIPAAVAIDAEMDDEAGFSELESGFERPAIIAGPVLDEHGQSWYDRHKIAPAPAAVNTMLLHHHPTIEENRAPAEALAEIERLTEQHCRFIDKWHAGQTWNGDHAADHERTIRRIQILWPYGGRVANLLKIVFPEIDGAALVEALRDRKEWDEAYWLEESLPPAAVDTGRAHGPADPARVAAASAAYLAAIDAHGPQPCHHDKIKSAWRRVVSACGDDNSALLAADRAIRAARRPANSEPAPAAVDTGAMHGPAIIELERAATLYRRYRIAYTLHHINRRAYRCPDIDQREDDANAAAHAAINAGVPGAVVRHLCIGIQAEASRAALDLQNSPAAARRLLDSL